MSSSNVSDYAIGDVQGCYDALQRLLDAIQFNEHTDRLWFVGDLVNRGPQSLAVLRFIKNLPLQPRISLGNHDLFLLSLIFVNRDLHGAEDTLQDVLNAPDCDELGHWLRKQSILFYDTHLNIAMCHAGIAPMWNLTQAKSLATELENELAGDNFRYFLSHMYGNKPNCWTDSLVGMTRLRVICNYFTRMRFCKADGSLALEFKESVASAPAHVFPWFSLPNRVVINADIVFGHWAALEGKCHLPHLYAIDTGCVWGKSMTALRLQDKQRMTVPGL